MNLLISFRNIIKQPRRTMISILAIILSVSLITCVGQVAENINKSMIKDVENISGKYYVSVSCNNVNNVVNNVKHESIYGISTEVGVANVDSLNLMCRGVNIKAADLLSIKIQNGNFPKDDNEVCIESWALKQLGYKIGDTIKVPIVIEGKEEKIDVKICGVLKDTPLKVTSSGSDSMMITTNEFAEKLVRNIKNANTVYIRYNDVGNIYQKIGKLKAAVNRQDKIKINTELIELLDSKISDYSIIFISLIIVIVSVICIYNVFNISSLERVKQFGTLRCIGVTSNEIFRIIMLEGVLLSIIAIPIGLFVGVLLSKYAFNLLFFVMNINSRVKGISYKYTVLAFLFGIITVLLSTLRPALYVKSLTALDALRDVGNTTIIEGEKNKVASLFERILGIKGRIAYENLWVHKSRTKLTISSISISIAVILTLLFWYKNYIYNTRYDNFKTGDYSILVDNNVDDYIRDEVFQEISGVNGVKKLYGFDSYDDAFFQFKSDKISVNKDFKEDIVSIDDSNSEIRANVYGYNEVILNECSKYMLNGKINVDKMKVEPIVVFDKTSLFSDAKLKVNVGDTINIKFIINGNRKIVNFKVGGIIENTPFNRSSWASGPEIIMSKEILDSILGREGYSNLGICVYENINQSKLKSELLKISKKVDSSKFISYAEEKEKENKEKNNIIILISTFVSVIFIISVLNIMNTISTSIIVRGKEFSMIRAIGISRFEMALVVIYEGLIWGILSSIIGFLLGEGTSIFLGIYLKEKSEILSIPWTWDLLVIIFNVVICIIVTIPPLQRILKNNIIESITE